ncbi:hypothetical protein L1276_000855 [Flavobacterium sp. HSC-32F16]|nr:hypothetical protein [Flavobacterium sp. HSC-32F16]
MRIIGFIILFLLSFTSKGQSKFETLRKQLIENKKYLLVNLLKINLISADFQKAIIKFSKKKISLA